MALSTLQEIRSNIEFTARETQISDRVDEFINLVINEINDFHLWSFLRRKTTFDTVASQEDYQLARDIDKIGLVRQTTSPIKIPLIPDEMFYLWVPNPTATGNPRWYRLWEEFGVETQITTAEKLNVVSDNTTDNQTITIVGTDANGYSLIETYTLSGIVSQSGSKDFTTIRQVSKSADTVGNVTVKGNTSSTTFVTLLPEERSPRFKRMSFYPIPSAEITISIEYFTRLRELVNDQDVPAIDRKWHYLIREGALSKVYQYQNKEADYLATWRIYRDGLKEMKKQDFLNVDFIPHLRDSNIAGKVKPGIFELADDTFAGHF